MMCTLHDPAGEVVFRTRVGRSWRPNPTMVKRPQEGHFFWSLDRKNCFPEEYSTDC